LSSTKTKTRDQHQLRLRVFAGPNGSGKSTVIKYVREYKSTGKLIDFGYYINADDIAASLRNKGLSFRDYDILATNKEFKSIAEGKNQNISAQLKNDDLFKWQVTMNGEDGTPYKDGTFFLAFEFPKNFPFSPPKVKFETKIYHMNVKSDTGEICLPELKDAWSPGLTMPKIIEKILTLLKTPETENPLESEVAQLYKSDRKKHDETAGAWVKKYAQ